MITENLPILKIYKLTQEQYAQKLANNEIDKTALYFTDDEDESVDIGDIGNLQVELDSIKETLEQKSQVRLVKSDITENLSILNIHKLTQEEYEYKLANGEIDQTALYFTDDEDVDMDMSLYATVEQLGDKADANHTHSISDVENLQTTLDTKVSTSITINGKALNSDIVLFAEDVGADVNGSANTALENAKVYADTLANGKADISHTHNDIYYTEDEIDTKVSDINASISKITNGTTVVAEATHASAADSATSADSATKAIQDASGNIIDSTYETKADAVVKLESSKTYTDTAVAQKSQVQIVTWGADD